MGGNTVAECMKLPGDEVQLWMAYRRQFGPLVLGARLDRGFAMVAHLVSTACGNKKSTFETWLPNYSPSDESEEDATLNDLIEDFGATL